MQVPFLAFPTCERHEFLGLFFLFSFFFNLSGLTHGSVLFYLVYYPGHYFMSAHTAQAHVCCGILLWKVQETSK